MTGTGRPNELLGRLLHAATAPAKLTLDPTETRELYDYIRWLEAEEWLADEEPL